MTAGARDRPAREGAQVLPVLALAAALAGCGFGDATPEMLEFENMDPENLVPKSSPAQFVAAFERYCLDQPSAAATAASLRATDYVEVPRRGGSGLRSFVVDDRRPAVILADDGRACGMAAESRTGQTARLRAMVARRFPAARALDPARIGANTEAAWAVADGKGAIVFVQRLTAPGQPGRLILGILRGR
ncbi:MAG: hypothetical protein IT545_07320 [Rhodobacteraceae bacterium]|nr:hypothetical protein [Paracoccaceae bacterium]